MASQEHKQRRLLTWMFILSLLGICSYFLKSQQVFPSASIDLKVSRADILKLSDKWAGEIGYKPDGAIKSTVFNYDDEGKTFLEHELGLTEANALMKDKVPIWYWSTRLCRPFKLDEFTTGVSPSGQIVSFEYTIENDKEMPSIAHAQARAMASKFVEEKIGVSLSGYKPVEDGTSAQPHRTDHYFTWEDTRQDFKGAHLRTYVYISGNKVTAYNHFLYIPESWIRKFSEMRSYNKALEEVASVFYVIFNVATFFAFIWMFTKGAIRWKVSLALAGLVAIMDYLESLNSMPNLIRSYTTTMSYNGYVLDIYMSALWSSLTQFLQTLMLAGAAEALYRLGSPAKVALEHSITSLGLRCRQVITGLCAGHALFGIHLGWVIAYYLLGEPLHFWSPLEVRNVESLSTVVPAFSAANVGVTAAVTEELTYRVLGMTIFQKLVKNFWLANLMQAAAWAFMHSNYPQEPAYARGVELTAVGFLYGFILRRFGLLPCIISHYVFDTFLGVTPLMSATSAGLKASAYISIAPFLILLACGFWLIKRKGWVADERLANGTIPLKASPAVVEEIFPHTPYRYQRLTRKTRLILAVVAIVASAIEFGYFFPTIGLDAKLSISREAAIERARTYMIDHKVAPLARMETAQLVRNVSDQELTEFQYLFEKVGFAKTAQLASSPCHQPVWQVKFFKPLDPEEYTVSLDAQGNPVSLDITRSEDAPGARLTEAQARKLVETYLRTEHPELKNYVFESAHSQERKARTDYKFTYKVPAFNVPGADFKVNVRVLGDLVSGFDQYWDLPDKWLFDLRKETTKDQVCGYVVAAIALVVLLAIIWWIIGVARSGAIHWRGPIIFGLAMSLLVIPQSLNDLAEFYASYSTETPLLNYFVAQCVRQVLTAVQMIGMAVGLGAFSLASFRLLFPRLSVTGILAAGMSEDKESGGDSRRDFWLDALLTGYAFGVGSRALLVLYAAIHAKISPVVTLAPLESLCNYANVLSPALDTLMDSLTRGVQAMLMSGIVAGIYAKYFRSVRGFLLFALAISLIYPSTDRYWQDYVIDALNYFMYFAGTWLFLKKIARQNLLAYFLAGATSMIAGSLRVLIAHGSYLFVQDIAILVVVLLSPLIYFAYLNSRTRPPSPAPAQPAEVGEYVQG